jgi:hypothetical protein
MKKRTETPEEFEKRETKALLDYFGKRSKAFGKKLKCPNHSKGIEFKVFEKTVNELAEPLSMAIDRYHRERWS